MLRRNINIVAKQQGERPMIKMIANGLRDMFSRLMVDEREAEYKFLAQAQDHAQLEYLMRVWDKQHRGRSNW